MTLPLHGTILTDLKDRLTSQGFSCSTLISGVSGTLDRPIGCIRNSNHQL